MRCEHCLKDNALYFETEIQENIWVEINRYECEDCNWITEEKVIVDINKYNLWKQERKW